MDCVNIKNSSIYIVCICISIFIKLYISETMVDDHGSKLWFYQGGLYRGYFERGLSLPFIVLVKYCNIVLIVSNSNLLDII